jgi:glycosyltransferase involved in cell wall biosynthesis
MKVLFLSNMYPPHVIGGYEALCQEVVDGLARRGHRVHVLTSTHGYKKEFSEGNIHRLLSLESDLHFYKMMGAWTYPQRRKRNLDHLRHVIETEQPDIVFIWGMWNLSKSLAFEVEKLMGSHVVYYLANPWPIEPNMHQAFWDTPATSPFRNYIKRTIRFFVYPWLKDEWERIHLRFENAPCCSEALRNQLLDAGIPLKDAQVIYEGIDLEHYLVYAGKRIPRTIGQKLLLVFVGILASHKGVHTLIEALSCLSFEDREKVHLTILGSGHPHYVGGLRRLLKKHHLYAFVTFYDRIPRADLPEFLSRFDVLLLPSIWSEPLARIMQEGLASGLVVIGSATGGTTEAIDHGKNGLLFSAGNAIDLARQIKYLLDNPQKHEGFSKEGIKTAKQKFNINVMVDRIENYLETVDEKKR